MEIVVLAVIVCVSLALISVGRATENGSYAEQGCGIVVGLIGTLLFGVAGLLLIAVAFGQ